MFANFRWQFSGGSLIFFGSIGISHFSLFGDVNLAGPESQGELDRASKERPRIAESKFEGHWWMFPGVAWRARRDRKYDMSAAVENELGGAEDRKRPEE